MHYIKGYAYKNNFTRIYKNIASPTYILHVRFLFKYALIKKSLTVR